MHFEGSFVHCHCVGEGADQEVRGGVGHGKDSARHEDPVGAEAGARSHAIRILALQILFCIHLGVLFAM